MPRNQSNKSGKKTPIIKTLKHLWKMKMLED